MTDLFVEVKINIDGSFKSEDDAMLLASRIHSTGLEQGISLYAKCISTKYIELEGNMPFDKFNKKKSDFLYNLGLDLNQEPYKNDILEVTVSAYLSAPDLSYPIYEIDMYNENGRINKKVDTDVMYFVRDNESTIGSLIEAFEGVSDKWVAGMYTKNVNELKSLLNKLK